MPASQQHRIPHHGHSNIYLELKSSYSSDGKYLAVVTKNGLWIKENIENGNRIISAKKPDGFFLVDVTIFHLNKQSNLTEKIVSTKANIKENIWALENVTLLKNENGMFEEEKFDIYKINSIYNHEKINSLFKNFDTMSFFDLVVNYKDFLKKGYNKTFLNQNLHSMLSLPFFLFMMTALAAILTLNTLKKSDNLKFIVVGLLVSVLIFYLKDLSIALGQTERIPLILAVWAPVIALSLFTFIGVLQINEK